MTLRVGELFAGYGGLGMAVTQAFGAELEWYAEFDKAPAKIMAHHWPGVPNHRDVTTVDWAQVEPVDIISGGSPCQDLSAAGRRAGMTEGTRSNLWVSMREAIATIKPKYVVWENVRGAYSAKATTDSDMEHCPGCMGTDGGDGKPLLRALGRVLGDLSDLGYDSQWRGLRAADVGAPHGRFRVFILAERRGPEPAHANHAGLERQRNPHGAAPSERHGHAKPRTHPSHHHHSAPANTIDPGQLIRPSRSQMRGTGTANTGISNTSRTRIPERANTSTAWGAYEPAIRRWKRVLGRPAPAPTALSATGKPQLSPAFVEWMMGLDEGHVTGIDGISRANQLKALGNGVVPQQALAALKDMITTDMDR